MDGVYRRMAFCRSGETARVGDFFFRGGGSTQPLHFRPVDVHFIHTSSDSSYLRRLSLWVYHERVGGRVQISAEIS